MCFIFSQGPDPSKFLLFMYSLLATNLSVANQSGSSKMTTTCPLPYIYTTCNWEHSSTTFDLPTLSVTEEDGCHNWSIVSSV